MPLRACLRPHLLDPKTTTLEDTRMVQIVQWNCRGLLHNIDDIHAIIHKYEPKIIALQETNLIKRHDNIFRNFHLLRRKTEKTAHAPQAVWL